MSDAYLSVRLDYMAVTFSNGSVTHFDRRRFQFITLNYCNNSEEAYNDLFRGCLFFYLYRILIDPERIIFRRRLGLRRVFQVNFRLARLVEGDSLHANAQDCFTCTR